MRRIIYWSAVFGLAGGLCCWALAWENKKNATAAARVAEAAALRQPGIELAELVRGCDEVRINYVERTGPTRHEARITDATFFTPLPSIFSAGTYQPTGPGLWVSDAEITLYRQQTKVLSLMWAGTLLRTASNNVSREFVISPTTSAALLDLLRTHAPAAFPMPLPARR
jgi:hypothetical protein